MGFDPEDQTIITYDSLSQKDIRSLIFHLLYAAQSVDYQDSLQAIAHNFKLGFGVEVPIDSYALKVAQEIINQQDFLDEQYKPFLANWNFDRISVSTKIILRFGIWELLNSDTDPRIIINEAIELAKCFAEKDAHRFINGILDTVNKSLQSKKEIQN